MLKPLLLLILLQIAPIKTIHADPSPPRCDACSQNSGNLEMLKEASEKQLRLSQRERKALLAARNKLVNDKLIKERVNFYKKQYDEFDDLVTAYENLVGKKNSNRDAFFAMIEDHSKLDTYSNQLKPGTMNLQNKRDQIKFLKKAPDQIWFKDPELKALMKELYQQDNSTRKDNAFEKLARSKIETEQNLSELDEFLKATYLNQKKSFLSRGGKTREQFDKDDLKDLEITFSPDSNEKPVLYPIDESTTNLNHDELIRKEMENVAKEYGKKPLFCKPVTATKADLASLLTESEPEDGEDDSVPEIAPLELPPLSFVKQCDLKQTFQNDETKVDPASLAEINNCLENAKNNPNCPNGVESISGVAQSCASTLRTKQEKSNADLSEKRANSMLEAFLKASKTILNLEATANRDSEESRTSYENSYEDETGTLKLSGTCGPRPPRSFEVEEWMKSSKGFCKNKSSADSSLQDACNNPTPSDYWKCGPSALIDSYDPHSPTNKVSKNSVQDYYREFRKASILITYTCKSTPVKTPASPPDTIETAPTPGDNTPDPLADNIGKMFIKCYFAKTTIDTTKDYRSESNPVKYRNPRPRKMKKKSTTDCSFVEKKRKH